MAKVNVIRWDAANLVPQLLGAGDTMMVNNIDVTGSAGTLKIGSTDATEIVLGGASNVTYVSGALKSLSIFSASGTSWITGTLDMPGGKSLYIDHIQVNTEQFNAANFTKLFNDSNVDGLHKHSMSISSASLTSSLLIDPQFVFTFTTEGVISGTDIVYLQQGNNVVDLADSDSLVTSRIIGIASGSPLVIYESGSEVMVQTIYGNHLHGFSGLTPGAVYYLDTVPGKMTTTPVAAGGRMVVEIGIACSPTELSYQPEVRIRGLA